MATADVGVSVPLKIRFIEDHFRRNPDVSAETIEKAWVQKGHGSISKDYIKNTLKILRWDASSEANGKHSALAPKGKNAGNDAIYGAIGEDVLDEIEQEIDHLIERLVDLGVSVETHSALRKARRIMMVAAFQATALL